MEIFFSLNLLRETGRPNYSFFALQKFRLNYFENSKVILNHGQVQAIEEESWLYLSCMNGDPRNKISLRENNFLSITVGILGE